MRLLYILVIVELSVAVDYNDELANMLRSYSNGGFLQSIIKLKDNFENFFHLNFNGIEKRRKIIQNAFSNFLRECTADEIKTTTPESKTTTEAVKKPRLRAENFDKLDFRQLAAADGYKSDSHIVVTEDGYLLTIHRLLPTSPNATIGKNGVVLLHHGLLGSSDDWILLGPKKGLPYLLLNAEYDVWLANARGNKYSRSHITKNTDSAAFWDFSWHEIGQFDLPAVIDYIKHQFPTDVQLNYVGYSMGATALLVLLSVHPEYNYFLKLAILIAPLAFMNEVKGPLQLLAQYYNSETLRYLGIKENAPLQTIPSRLIKLFCKTNTKNCRNPLQLLTTGAEEPNKDLQSKIDTYTPGGGSMKTIIHYIQLIRSGQFRMFNPNFSNLIFKSPPPYDINSVVSPVVVFGSLGDWLATAPDINTLLFKLPNVLLYHKVASDDFNHLDFMWSDRADIFVYYIILDILNQVQSSNTTGI